MVDLLKCCFTSTDTVGLLGTGAQDVHLDFHTETELRSCVDVCLSLYNVSVSIPASAVCPSHVCLPVCQCLYWLSVYLSLPLCPPSPPLHFSLLSKLCMYVCVCWGGGGAGGGGGGRKDRVGEGKRGKNQ